MVNETQAWTERLGYELQRLSSEGATELELSRLDFELTHAIKQVKFVRKCYNKSPAIHPKEVN